ncbi:hypothetical protein SEPCBS57363_002353 [Sporothrix epigloea]|uniref:RRM domain-containing protein n=1 Tax=Sporothrix epigloea TaxID=1892477 RepID=A0ABP0DH62_9PEZI
MANMDVSLDEILADHKGEPRNSNNNGNRRNNDRNDRNDRIDRNDRNGNDRNGSDRGRSLRDRGRRDDYPRDGVRKSYRDEPRKIDEEWVHDRYYDNGADYPNKFPRGRLQSEQRSGTRIRVDNLHYELSRDDLVGLFSRIGPVTSVELVYDRAGRSDGIAYVTYEDHEDARAAVREFDGANAKGQPIRLSIVAASGRQKGGKAGVVIGGGRPLADRISQPKHSGDDDGEQDDNSRTSLSAAVRQGIDRYVPGGTTSGRLSRSRSPGPRRREGGGGRRPGERRGGRGSQNGGGRDGQSNSDGGNRRPRKTQEELDAEMADYFVENSNGAVTQAVTAADAASAVPLAAAPANDDGDEDMIL